jgi:hypothetical protein
MDTREVLIKNLHFIWIGGKLYPHYQQNIINWIRKIDCQFNVFLWVDRNNTPSIDIIEMKKVFMKYKKIRIYDVNDDLFTKSTIDLFRETEKKIDKNYENDTYTYLVQEYRYESGIDPRPQVGERFKNVKNFGYSTDILRLMILFVFGGFYCDTDIEPIDICQYHNDVDIKTCPLKLCFSTNIDEDAKRKHPGDIEKSDIILNTNSIYMNNRDLIAIKSLYQYFLNIISYSTKYVRSDEYNYIVFNFRHFAINTTGPQAIPKYGDNSNHLYGFFEEKTLGAEHSWFLSSNKYSQILSKVYEDICIIYQLRFNKNGANSVITYEMVNGFYEQFQSFRGDKTPISKENIRILEKFEDLYIIYLEIMYDDFFSKVMKIKPSFFKKYHYTYDDLYNYIMDDQGLNNNVLSDFFTADISSKVTYETKSSHFPQFQIVDFMTDKVKDYEVTWKKRDQLDSDFFGRLLTRYNLSFEISIKKIRENNRGDFFSNWDLVKEEWEENFSELD